MGVRSAAVALGRDLAEPGELSAEVIVTEVTARRVACREILVQIRFRGVERVWLEFAEQETVPHRDAAVARQVDALVYGGVPVEHHHVGNLQHSGKTHFLLNLETA